MPNWCDTSYKCVGDLKEVKSLHKVLKYMEKRKTSILKNGFGKMWLGNLVHKLGGDWEKSRCRGEITDFSLDGNVLTINQETAWCEQEGVRQIIEKTFQSIKVYFMEQEPGCGVFTQTMLQEIISQSVTFLIHTRIGNILKISMKQQILCLILSGLM